MKRFVIAATIASLTGLGLSSELIAAPPQAEKSIAGKSILSGQRQIRGAYLAQAGNCMGCHTAQGGLPYAGGRNLSTPFGTFTTPNITPDRATGIGQWREEDFWKALHEGKSRDGRPLYPAFPYTEYTKITREDSDAIFAHLQTLAPVAQNNPPSTINFPYNFQPLLATGGPSTSSPVFISWKLRKARSGTEARTWCRASDIAMPATPNAIRWAPPVATNWGEDKSWAPTGTRHP